MSYKKVLQTLEYSVSPLFSLSLRKYKIGFRNPTAPLFVLFSPNAFTFLFYTLKEMQVFIYMYVNLSCHTVTDTLSYVYVTLSYI